MIVRSQGTPGETMQRLQEVASDWRDSARPEELRGFVVAPLTFEVVEPDGFRFGTPIIGSRFFGVTATGTVTADKEGTYIRFQTALDPSFGKAAVQVGAFVTVIAAILALSSRDWSILLVLPPLGTAFMIAPSWIAAEGKVDGHGRALTTLIKRAAS